MLIRFTLLLALLGAPLAWGDCVERCNDQVASCASRCRGDPACSNPCSKRYTQCAKLCNDKPKALPKKCLGAKGKQVDCTELQGPKVPPKPEPQPEDKRTLKDFQKDPEFKGLLQGLP